MRVMVFHNFSKRITNFCIELIGAIATSKFSVVANRSVDVTFCLPEKFEGRGDENFDQMFLQTLAEEKKSHPW